MVTINKLAYYRTILTYNSNYVPIYDRTLLYDNTMLTYDRSILTYSSTIFKPIFA